MTDYEYQLDEDGLSVPRTLLLRADPDDATVDDYPGNCVAFTARTNGEVIGAAVLLPDHDTIEIINLAVEPEHRNNGVGTTLLERAVSYAGKCGARRLVIRTASTSVKQLLLYQRVGFRFSEIDHGHFTRNHFRPLIENGVRCIDQISLVFPMYRESERRALVDEYWGDFILRNPVFSGLQFSVWSFGHGPRQANELLNLVVAGTKTATASSQDVLSLEHEPAPVPDAISVLTYGSGCPGAVIQTISVEVRPFMKVDEEFARLEGEGDGSLEHWREGHRRHFTRELARHGKTFNDRMPVVCERFQVLDVNRELALTLG